MTKYIEHSVRR